MKIGVTSRIRREDLKEAPAWIDGLLGTLNSFIERVVSALTGRLTFQDNFQCKVIYEEFTDNIEKIVSVPPGYRVSGAIPLLALNAVITGCGVTLRQDQTTGVTVRIQGGGSAFCRIVLTLEA